MQADVAEKPAVTAAQRRLLESRYDLTPRLDPAATMSRGKPLAVGPTARLASGISWDRLAGLSPEKSGRARCSVSGVAPSEAGDRRSGVPAAPVAIFPRLERFDVELTSRRLFSPSSRRRSSSRAGPNSGTSRGVRSSRSTTSTAVQGHLTPVQLDGSACSSHRFRRGIQSDRRPEDGPAQPRSRLLRLSRQRPHHGAVPPDARHPAAAPPLPARHDEPPRGLPPADPRLEAEPPVGGGLHRVRATDRVLQRGSDPGDEEGHEHPRPDSCEPHGAAPEHARLPAGTKLDAEGRLIAASATETERRGEAVFFGKGRCGQCHPAPFYLDQQMHDLRVERF